VASIESENDEEHLRVLPPTPVSQFWRDEIEKNLRPMNEPDLGNIGAESLRLVWLRSFDEPVVVRLEHHQSGATLYLKVLEERERNVFRLSVDRTMEISEAQWAHVQALLAQLDFWHAPEDNHGAEIVEHGVVTIVAADGSRWFLEGRGPNDYRLIMRANPVHYPREPAFNAVCLELLQLAAYSVTREQLY
jgi:hypothetical protein